MCLKSTWRMDGFSKGMGEGARLWEREQGHGRGSKGMGEGAKAWEREKGHGRGDESFLKGETWHQVHMDNNNTIFKQCP